MIHLQSKDGVAQSAPRPFNLSHKHCQRTIIIEYLILFTSQALPRRYKKHFGGGRSKRSSYFFFVSADDACIDKVKFF